MATRGLMWCYQGCHVVLPGVPCGATRGAIVVLPGVPCGATRGVMWC